MSARKKLCFVVSDSITVKAFLIDQIRKSSEVYDVCVVVNSAINSTLGDLIPNAEFVRVRIERKISPIRDLVALASLIHLFSKRRFDIVHSISPKAGFLAVLAGFLTRIPLRIHTFTGQVWASSAGMPRVALKTLDKILAQLATHLLTDSKSQLDFLEAQRVVPLNKCCVLGKGSISGVDPMRFRPDSVMRKEVRDEIGLSNDDILFLYLGRITRDKGVLDLASAFARIAQQSDNARLLFVGPDETGLSEHMKVICEGCSKWLFMAEYTDKPERYMAAADVFCLPSYREGFGTVILEAAASGLPAIGSRIYGICDAIEDGQTGLLFSPRDMVDLMEKMTVLLQNKALRVELGRKAQSRALADFSMQSLTQALLDYYQKLSLDIRSGCAKAPL